MSSPQYVDYINLEYVLVRAYDFVAGFSGIYAAIPSGTAKLLEILIVSGMVLSFILLILLVYAQIRLLQVEHAGFHMMEEHAHTAHDTAPLHPQNERWRHIEALAASSNPSDWRRAILEADIMLGDELSAAGYKGASVGEQLKMANPLQLTTLDLAWKAHKVRNDVAHGGEQFVLTDRDVRSSIDYFKRVFEELGVL
jgi:hypothetical protein